MRMSCERGRVGDLEAVRRTGMATQAFLAERAASEKDSRHERGGVEG